MKKFFCFIAGCFICFSWINYTYCQYILIDKTVAFVGEEVILESDLLRYACYVALKTDKPVESFKRRDLLIQMIDEIVLVQEATKTGIVKAWQENVSKSVEEAQTLIEGKSGWCESADLDENYIAEMSYNNGVIEMFIKKRIEAFVKVAERDVYRYYLSKSDEQEEEYNEEIEDIMREELKKVLVEKELSGYLRRVKKRIKIVIPED
jgi:hypothetical protein